MLIYKCNVFTFKTTNKQTNKQTTETKHCKAKLKKQDFVGYFWKGEESNGKKKKEKVERNNF